MDISDVLRRFAGIDKPYVPQGPGLPYTPEPTDADRQQGHNKLRFMMNYQPMGNNLARRIGMDAAQKISDSVHGHRPQPGDTDYLAEK